MKDLQKCTKCNKEPTYIYNFVEKSHIVYCNTCGITTKACDTEVLAREDWNTKIQIQNIINKLWN